ncbi:fasciclin domain-containing protein [Aliihoeflea sp. 40Bstr573]|uniref:fasciclin domain-containing protein n=1 Tax=Aliihoeflea sp. 40Bstr573 TaxID=2696467 RepID=UPI0020964009|nr:fasciclin domain-containing protein [Aliihoeflea sp. 40Bstr573]MCO6388272.1 fasciclin domain-containing protein [Aliihoeflea sp. 40Bstr573]
MKKLSITTLLVSVALGLAAPAMAQENPTVGGAPMLVERNIVENAVNSPVHTTLVAAVKAADLAGTLSGPGPFTVFAPVNDAFAMLPAGTVETLLMSENKDQLSGVLTYHVVPGKLSGPELLRRANAGGGEAQLTTVQGGTLTVVPSGRGVAVMDGNGTTSVVTTADVNQSNGVIHVVNRVLLP